MFAGELEHGIDLDVYPGADQNADRYLALKLRITKFTMTLHLGSRANFPFQAQRAIVFDYFNVPSGREEWCTDFVGVMAMFMFPVAVVDLYCLEVFIVWISDVLAF